MSIEAIPLSDHVGVELKGLDLKAPAAPETTEELRAAFRDHHLLLVRQPGLNDEEQLRFARTFGEVSIRYARPNEERQSLTQYVSNTRADGILGDGEIVFHQDHVFYPEP